MGRTKAPVTSTAVLAGLYAAWHFTGGMHGTVVHVHTPAAASAVTTTAVTATGCEPLPGTAPAPSPSPTASPSTASGAPQLCVDVQATQGSIKRGKTATWTVQVQIRNGPATSVTVTLTATPAGLPPVFTSSCPSGGGTATCTVGDIGTPVTPSSYQLQAQITVPATTSAGNLTLTASADTSPAMTATPAAGQTITISGTVTKTSSKPTSTPSPARTTTAPPTPARPATQPAILPVTRLTAAPTIGGLSTADPVTTTVAPGSVATALPQITPVVATAPAPAATVTTSPAANIQAAGANPSTSPTQDGNTFSISIGMSARTAQVLGFILLVLVFVLTAAKLTSGYLNRTRQLQQKEPETTAAKPRIKFPALHLPRPHLARLHFPRARLPRPHLRHRKQRTRPNRAERRAIREQNWRRYLETQQPPAVDQTVTEETPEAVMTDPS